MIGGSSTISLQELFADCGDVICKRFLLSQSPADDAIQIVYCIGLVDIKTINTLVFPEIMRMIEQYRQEPSKPMEETQFLNLTTVQDNSSLEVVQLVFAGHVVLYLEKDRKYYSLDVANRPNRQPEESNMEVSIKGARDAFTEDLHTNMALIRKRMRSETLCYEKYIIGTRSKTEVGLAYLRDVAKPELIEEARIRLQNIETETPSLGLLEEALGDRRNSMLPLVDSSTRPDFAISCLLNGRFVFLLDGSPTCLIAPAPLLQQLKSAEDSYIFYFFVGFERFLRIIGLLLATFITGFWIALISFHPDQLPMPLLATISMGRMGIPFSVVMETFIMQIMFEIFREAGIRLPKAVGQTVAVVGGLIVGDAAIRAGLTSPAVLVITAVSAVSTFTIINPTLSGAVTLLKFIVMIMSGIFGLYGFFMVTFAICVYLTSLESFNIPYLSPLAPIQVREVLQALFVKPRIHADEKPSLLSRNTAVRRKGGR